MSGSEKDFPDWEALYKNQKVETMPWYNENFDFDLEVNSQLKYNKHGKPAEGIPIIYYHRIDDSGALYSTHPSLFAAEMKYLHDNDFEVIRMDSLAYNNATNSFYLNQ